MGAVEYDGHDGGDEFGGVGIGEVGLEMMGTEGGRTGCMNA